MARSARLITTAFIATLPLVGIDYLTNSGYLALFSRDQSTSIMLTLLGINVAAVTFVLAQLVALEEKFQKRFSRTRSELKQNLYFMAILVAINLVVATTVKEDLFHLWQIDSSTAFGYLSVTLTALVIVAMLEIVGIIIKLDGTQGPSKNRQ